MRLSANLTSSRPVDNLTTRVHKMKHRSILFLCGYAVENPNTSERLPIFREDPDPDNIRL